MAVTWAGLRDTGLRYILKDVNQAAYRWSNAELLVYANHGLDSLSGYYPYQKSATITRAEGTYTYALPTDFRFLDAVCWPSSALTGQSVYVEKFRTSDNSWPYFGSSGTAAPTIYYLLGYPDEDSIAFTRVPPSDLTIYYRAARPHVAGDTDTLPFGRQNWMAEALVYYICYQCYLRDSGPRAELAQWAEKPELGMDNPLATQATFWLKQYQRLVNENQGREYNRFTEGFKVEHTRHAG